MAWRRKKPRNKRVWCWPFFYRIIHCQCLRVGGISIHFTWSYSVTSVFIVYHFTEGGICPSMHLWTNTAFSRKSTAGGYWGFVFLFCLYHDDVIKWKHFSRNWPFVRGNHRLPVNYPHKGQWSGALVFSLSCIWINGWVNNREAGDLRRPCAHYDVTVMLLFITGGPLLQCVCAMT